MSLGTSGYALYIGGLWAFQVHGVRWFLILSGAILGVTAALLWSAQGAIMMAYPLEKDKGRSFTLFWSIFQMGTIVGAAIALGIEAHSTLPGVSTGVYLAFIIIMLTAIVTSWLLLPPHSVVRGDGTVVELEDAISPLQEFKELRKVLSDWRLWALFPMFFSSNYFYAYQSAIVTVLFNGRTRALVSLVEGVGQVLGGIIIGQLTDNLPCGRRKRALWSALFVLVLNCVVWAGGLAFQVGFTRSSTVVRGEEIPWDWTVGVAAGPIVLLMAYYLADATYQGLAYYTMSSLTNEPFKLARMAGYYKGVQSAGSAISFGMDAVKVRATHPLILFFLEPPRLTCLSNSHRQNTSPSTSSPGSCFSFPYRSASGCCGASAKPTTTSSTSPRSRMCPRAQSRALRCRRATLSASTSTTDTRVMPRNRARLRSPRAPSLRRKSKDGAKIHRGLVEHVKRIFFCARESAVTLSEF